MVAKWNDPTLQLGRLDECLRPFAATAPPNGWIHPDAALFHFLSTTGAFVPGLGAFQSSRGLGTDAAWEAKFRTLPNPPGKFQNNMKTWRHWLLPFYHSSLWKLAHGYAAFQDPFTGGPIDNSRDNAPYLVKNHSDPWLWVLLPDGYFLAMLGFDDEWKHSSLASGSAVLAAGELGFSQGYLRWMSLQSGHYMSGLTSSPTLKGQLGNLKAWLSTTIDVYWSHYSLPGVRPRIRTSNSQFTDEV